MLQVMLTPCVLARNIYNKKLTDPSKTQSVKPNTALTSRIEEAALVVDLAPVAVVDDVAVPLVFPDAPAAELPVLPEVPELFVERPVLPGVAEEDVPFTIPSPPVVVDADTAGHVRLKYGVVERLFVMANLAALTGFESRKLYHQTLVLPKMEHPTWSQ